MSGDSLYLSMDIIRRLKSGEVVIYRCFKKLPDHGYAVQSADRLHLPLREEDLKHHQRQLWELLIEEAPDARGGLFATVEEAIENFERSFAD